jgi:DNA-binding response OmpR family regulator
VFNVNPKTLERLAPGLQRVLIVDSNAAATRLLADLMKDMGARQTLFASNLSKAIGLTREFDPQLIFTEFSGPDFDGVDFAQKVRRGGLPASRAPIIMITAEATAASIIGARNAGVHEFLRKPYTGGDLFRRVENVITKPRTWIEAKMYVGPDRRRFNSGEYAGAKKRHADAAAVAAAAPTIEQALQRVSAA